MKFHLNNTTALPYLYTNITLQIKKKKKKNIQKISVDHILIALLLFFFTKMLTIPVDIFFPYKKQQL
jgi:hypothetical protein